MTTFDERESVTDPADAHHKFQQAMIDAGWTAYGNGSQWQHNNGYKVDYDSAFRFWLETGLTVMPW